MSAPGEQNILYASSGTAISAGLYTKGEDVRTYPGHRALPETHKDMNDLAPRSVAGNGNGWTYQFETSRNADRFEQLWLVVTIAALNVVGGTYKYLCDGFGLALIDRIEFRSNNQLIHTVYPTKSTFARFDRSYTTDEREKIYPQVGLGMTTAERSAAATGAQTFYIPVDSFWHDDATKDLIIPGLSTNLFVYVYLRADSDLVETDGAAPASPATIITYTNVALRTELIHTDARTRQMQVARVAGGNKLTMLYKETVAIPSFTVASGSTTSGLINIEGLTGAIQELFIEVRRRADTTTAYSKKWFNFLYSQIPDTVRITSNNNSDVLRLIRLKDFLKPISEQNRYSGGVARVAAIVFAETPESALTATGHLDMQLLTQPRMTLTWDTALTEDVEVTLWGVTRNWVEHDGGALRRVFNP
jgi:hypothetical protein